MAEGCAVRGFIDDVYGDNLLRYRCATLQPKDLLQAWVMHVLLGTVKPAHRTVVFSPSEKPRQFQPFSSCAEAQQLAGELLHLYRRGLSETLPFIPDASWAAAKSLAESPDDPVDATNKARSEWIKKPYGARESRPALCDDPYHQLVHGPDPDFSGEFLTLATSVLSPLLARLGDASP